MAYKWTDTETIQAYLDAASSTMRIGGNSDFSVATAELFENEAVFEITTILSAAWSGIENLTADTVSVDLKKYGCEVNRLTSRSGADRWDTWAIDCVGQVLPK